MGGQVSPEHQPRNTMVTDSFKIIESSYGKGGVKILHVSKQGSVHTIRELEVETLLTLNNHKDYGGYAGEARVRSDWALKLPEGLTGKDAAKIGTAGYTAMLCVQAMEHSGVTPASGPVLVTGATGGVGGVATLLLSQLGYHVVALSG